MLNVLNTQSLVTWTYGSTDLTGFFLESSADSGSTWTSSLSCSSDTASYYDNNVTWGDYRWYRVAALSPFGPGPESNLAEVFINSPGIDTPRLTGSQYLYNALAALSWSYTGSSQGSTDSFIMERSADSGSTWAYAFTVSPSGSSINDGSVSQPATYIYRIRSHCDFGLYSSFSNLVEVDIIELSMCVASPIPTGDFTGSLTNSSPTSSYRPGYYADTLQYVGTSGSVLNVFMNSLGSFMEYVSLIDPLGSVITGSGGTTNFGAVIQSPLTMDGTYTIEASTDSPGAQGTYRLRVSSGPTMTLDLSSSYPSTYWYNVGFAYSPTSSLMFISDQNNPIVTVISPASNSIVNFLVLTSSIANSDGVFNIVYGSAQDKMYASVDTFGGGSTLWVQVFNSDGTLGATIDTGMPTGVNDYNIDYDYVHDRIVVLSSTVSSPNFAVIDCTNNTVIHTDHLGGEPISIAYAASTNAYYVTTAYNSGIVYKIDASTFAVTTSTLVSNTDTIVYIKEVDKLILYDVTVSGVVFADPTTEAVTSNTSLNEFEYAIFDPCSNAIRLMNYLSGMYEYETSSFALVNRWPIVNYSGSYSLNEGPGYATINSMTYTIDRFNNVVYATPMDNGQLLIPPAPPTSSNAPYIVNYASVLSQWTGEGTCVASAKPAWDGTFPLNTTWGPTLPGTTGPLYYFIGQSILGLSVSADDCAEYPSGNWQYDNCCAQIYWNGSNWSLWISCVSCGTVWNGTSDTTDITNPAGTYTQSGTQSSSGPATIVIAV